MSERPSPSRAALLGAALLVAAWGIAFAYFLWRSHFEPPRRTYRLDWGSPWIAYGKGEPGASYFRKQLYIPAGVRHAWIQVAAVDTFQLFVNDHRVGASNRVGFAASGVWDISSHLVTGTNVLAVAAERVSFPGGTRIAVEGAYTDWQGETHPFGGDETWRVTLLPEGPARGGPRWTTPGYDDVRWERARTSNIPLRREDTKINYPPRLLIEPSPARWSWGPTAEDAQAYVRCEFEATADTTETWLEVGAAEAYAVFVNGVLIGHQDSWVGVSGEREGEARRVIDVYNASRFVRPGPNVLAIAASGAPAARRLLAGAMLIGRDFTVQRFVTPSACRAEAAPVAGWTEPGFDDSTWSPLRAEGTTSALAEALTQRRVTRPSFPDSYRARSLALRGVVILGSLAGAGLLWLAAGALSARCLRVSLREGLSRQRLPYLWSGLFLGVLFLLSFDTRFSTYFSFRMQWVLWSVAIVLLLHLLLLLPSRLRAPRPRLREGVRRAWRLGALLVLVVMGLALRLRGIDVEPLTGDEVTMAIVSQSIWTHGVPVRSIASDLPLKYFTTSEIVPYPMSLTMWLLGTGERGVRMAGVLFDVGTIVLLYAAGCSMFSPRVGLLAAGLYSWLPFAIKMSHYARYPSQLAFFALLTSWLLYRALRSGCDRRFCALTSCAASLTYLTWEGSVFMIPALLAGMILLRRRDLGWLRAGAVWGAGAAFALLIFCQLSARLDLSADWPGLGIGISQLVPTPLWRQPLFAPWVYVTRFFALENLQTTSLLAAVGLAFAVRDRALSFVLATLAVTTVLMTLFLETQDSRHIYHMLPLLLLAGACAFWHLTDLVVRGLETGGGAGLARAGLLGFFLLSANTYVLKLYGLPGDHNVDYVRLEADRPGGVTLAFPQVPPGGPLDRATISYQPHVIWYYFGRADYYAETRLQIPVAVASDAAMPVHRLTGSPLIYSLDDLRWALASDPRAVVVMPRKGTKVLSREVRAFLGEQMKVVYEDARVRVYALTFTRWEGA